jgi:hypothetical protein
MQILALIKQEIKTTNILIKQTEKEIEKNESIIRLYLMEMEGLVSELNYLRRIKNYSFVETMQSKDTIDTKISRIEARLINEATDNKQEHDKIKKGKQLLKTLELDRERLIKEYINLVNSHDGANVDDDFIF